MLLTAANARVSVLTSCIRTQRKNCGHGNDTCLCLADNSESGRRMAGKKQHNTKLKCQRDDNTWRVQSISLRITERRS